MQDFLKQAARLLKRLRPEAKAALAGMAAAMLLLFLVLLGCRLRTSGARYYSERQHCNNLFHCLL